MVCKNSPKEKVPIQNHCKQPKKMKKLTLIILASLCIFGCAEINQTDNLRAKVDSLKIKNDSLTKILAEEKPKILDEEKPESNYWYNPQYDGQKFIENGITNPVEFIENNLRNKTELIPIKAVLGGTMHFGKIQLLSDEWLIANYEDGHIQGRAIYKYKLDEKGKLEFELLNSTKPE